MVPALRMKTPDYTVGRKGLIILNKLNVQSSLRIEYVFIITLKEISAVIFEKARLENIAIIKFSRGYFHLLILSLKNRHSASQVSRRIFLIIQILSPSFINR